MFVFQEHYNSAQTTVEDLSKRLDTEIQTRENLTSQLRGAQVA